MMRKRERIKKRKQRGKYPQVKSGNINMKQKDRLNELKRSKRDGQTNGMKERKIEKMKE